MSATPDGPIAIYYEHPDWFRPLFAELDRRGIPYARIEAALQPAEECGRRRLQERNRWRDWDFGIPACVRPRSACHSGAVVVAWARSVESCTSSSTSELGRR